MTSRPDRHTDEGSFVRDEAAHAGSNIPSVRAGYFFPAGLSRRAKLLRAKREKSIKPDTAGEGPAGTKLKPDIPQKTFKPKTLSPSVISAGGPPGLKLKLPAPGPDLRGLRIGKLE